MSSYGGPWRSWGSFAILGAGAGVRHGRTLLLNSLQTHINASECTVLLGLLTGEAFKTSPTYTWTEQDHGGKTCSSLANFVSGLLIRPLTAWGTKQSVLAWCGVCDCIKLGVFLIHCATYVYVTLLRCSLGAFLSHKWNYPPDHRHY